MKKHHSRYIKVSKFRAEDRYYPTIRDMCRNMNEILGKDIFDENDFYHRNKKPPLEYKGYKIEYINIIRKS